MLVVSSDIDMLELKPFRTFRVGEIVAFRCSRSSNSVDNEYMLSNNKSNDSSVSLVFVACGHNICADCASQIPRNK